MKTAEHPSQFLLLLLVASVLTPTDALANADETLVMFQDPACTLESSKIPGRRPEPMKVHAFFSCLNEYGKRLLADRPSGPNPLVEDLKLTSQTQPSLSDFSIRIPLLDTECIPHPHARGTATQVVNQMRSAALFLREFYKSTDGQTSGPMIVREIEICSEDSLKRSLKIENGTLKIGLPKKGFMGHREMLEKWNNGDAYHDSDLLSRAKRRLDPISAATAKLEWALLNPVSPLRASVRSALQERGRDLANRIGLRSAHLSPSAQLRVELRRSNLVRKGLVQETVVEEMTEAEASNILESWKSNLRSAQTSDGLATSVLALQSRKSRFAVKRDVWALLVVSNWHHVGTRVSVQTSLTPSLPMSAVESLQKGRSEEVSVEHEFKFRGLIAIDTIDHIQTDLDVMVESAGQSTLEIQKDAMLLLALENNGLISF